MINRKTLVRIVSVSVVHDNILDVFKAPHLSHARPDRDDFPNVRSDPHSK